LLLKAAEEEEEEEKASHILRDRLYVCDKVKDGER